MAKKQSKGLNKYIADFDKLRTFLRYLSYGCYHKKNLAEKLGQSPRSYEDNWARVQFFLPDDRLQFSRQGHREIHSLRGDSYHSSYNDLAKIYQIKSMTTAAMFSYLCLWQIFSIAEHPLQETEIYQYAMMPINRPYPAQMPEISRSTLHRYLQELAVQGILKQQKQNGRYVYELAEDFLADLSAEEAELLQDAITFYRNISLLSVPGYFLSQTLTNSYGKSFGNKQLCQFKHTAIARILDDEVLQCLFYCIEQHREVHFRYRGKEVSVLPQKITTDFYVGRQYLQGVAKRKQKDKAFNLQQKYRLDWIERIRPGKQVNEQKIFQPEAKQQIEFELFYSDEREKQRLLLRLHEHEKGIEVCDKRENILLCRMQLVDELKLLPWLRTFYPQIRLVGEGKAKLQTRMEADIEEALTNYGICTTVS